MKDLSAREDLSVEALVGEVADQFTERLNRGERPDVEEYARQYPRIAALLREALPALEAMVPLASDPPLTSAPEVFPEHLTGCLGDFRILREVGRGGMGIVYEAEQISLDRRVALKVLPFAGALDPKQLQRFKNEAKAAAQLHHTNIVPVFGVGCEGGIHYYAMQFIDGQTLAAVIQELRQSAAIKGRGSTACASSGDRPGPQGTDAAAAATATPTRPVVGLSTEPSTRSPGYFRTVARLGVQAAEALEHAHSLGVVHRDIKPANLLLDLQGNLWVTDFGLAHFQRQPGLTLTGDVVGTLRYMSPEQALAKRALVDHRADVYSLGATLYELLTLEPAFAGGDPQEVRRQIAEDEPRSPKRLNPALPAELETIVLKTLAKEPAERYATAQELADDLRRYLADEPIVARRPTLRQRLVKWTRRHKTAVRVAIAALVLAVGGLTVSNVRIAREQARTEAQRQQTEVQRRQTAENLRLALQVLDKIYLRIAEKQLPRHPGQEQEDREFLQEALRFYEAFAQVNNEPTLRLEQGQAYIRIGEIQRLLGQHAQAELAYGHARRLFAQLVAEVPDEPAHLWELARSWHSVGLIFQVTNRFPEAREAYRRAMERYQKLLDNFPADPTYPYELASSYNNLATLLQATGQPREAEEAHRQAVALRQQLTQDFPTVTGYQQKLASSYYNLAVLLKVTGRLPEAEQRCRQAQLLQEKLVAGASSVPTYREDLGRTGLGERPRSVPRTSVSAFRRDLGCTHCLMGNLLEKRARYAEAEQAFQQAQKLQKELVHEYPQVPDYAHELACSHNNLGGLFEKIGRNCDAENEHRQALALKRELVNHFPNVPEYRHGLAVTYSNLGNLMEKSDRHQEAEQAFRQALELGESLVGQFALVPSYRHLLAASHHNLGNLLKKTSRLADAEQAYRQALKLLKWLADESPKVPEYRCDFRDTRNNLVTLLRDRGELLEARQLVEQALREQKAARKGNPGHPTAYRGSQCHYYLLADILGRQGDHAGMAQMAEELPQVFSDNLEAFYDAACFTTLCIPLVQKDGQLTKDQCQELVQKYGARAVQLLREAAAKGFPDVEHLKGDTDLDPLRGRADFQKFQRELEAKR
jgi:serine/threonine protein kinase